MSSNPAGYGAVLSRLKNKPQHGDLSLNFNKLTLINKYDSACPYHGLYKAE
jgi:hypothetical protein